MFSRCSLIAIVATLLLITNTSLAQTASFTSNTKEGCFPLTVEFKDTSIGTVTDWLWDFGNGNTSTEKDPKAIYAAPGTYNVSLKVSNNGGTPSTIIRSAFIVVHDFPSVDFSYDKVSGCAPLQVKFTDKTSTASGQIASYEWTFGDGGSSINANPTYTFKDPGNRTIALRVRNEFGCEKVKVSTTPITVNGPVSKFSVDNAAVCTLPAAFQFTNETTGTNVTYKWNFGDGQTSTATSPAHTYTTAGSFKVTLTSRDGNGCETSIEKSISAGSEGGLDFSMSTNVVCLGQQVDFSLISTDAPVNAKWDFDDGQFSTANDTTHVYRFTGNYTVTLNAKLLNHTCNSIVKKTISVVVPSTPTFTQKLDCDYNLTLTNTSQNTSSVEWYVNNEFVSTLGTIISPVHASGAQEIKLVAYDAAGCNVTLVRTVNVPENPSPAMLPNDQQSCTGLSLSGCAPFKVDFQNKTTAPGPVTIKWDFGDGTSTTAGDPTHFFNTKGLYQVTLTATDSKGCSKTATSFVIVADKTPVPDFEIDKNTQCASQDIKFTDKSIDADFWCWDFGDGTQSAGKEVLHKYQRAGTYDVTLRSKNAGCFAEKKITHAVTILNPEVGFSRLKQCSDPFKITVVNNSKNYNSLSWNFGDGQTSNAVNPGSHTYAQEGTYVLTISAKNDTTGCSTNVSESIVVQKVEAKFSVNTDKPCKGAPLVFTDESHAAEKWLWTIDNNSFTIQNPVTSINTSGSHVARLDVIDSDGCISTATKNIDVLDMAGDFKIEEAVSDCNELSVQFQNLSRGTPTPTDFTWNFGDGDTSFELSPMHAYTTPGKYTVALTVKNDNGSCIYSKADAVNFTVPDPQFETETKTFCPGDVVQVANISKNATTYLWDYGDGRRSDFKSPQIQYTTAGKYDLTLFASDSYGCEKRLTKSQLVSIQKPTANFSVVDSPSGSCPPFTAKFADGSSATVNEWLWDFGDGNKSSLPNPQNPYLKPGAFDVKLTVTDANGCTDTKSVGQLIKVGGPSGRFTSDGANSCINKSITFSATVNNTSTLRWDFGDGVVVDNSKTNVEHAYTKLGSFIPQLLLIDAQGCQTLADGSGPFVIKDTTAVSMNITPLCINTGDKFTIVGKNDNDSAPLTWLWTIDEQDAGSGNQIESSVDASGIHIVNAFATNSFGCTSRLIDTVRVQGPLTLIPNIITPNDDGFNDSFKIIGLEQSTWDLHVINRWGNPVYTKSNYRGEWDGENQPSGVYFYILRNAICNDDTYKGYISVNR